MRQFGRYQMRVRTLFLMPAMLAFAWWLADHAIEWQQRSEDYQGKAALHERDETLSRTFAVSLIPDHIYEPLYRGTYSLGGGRIGCKVVGNNRPLTEAEKSAARRLREQAGRLTAYHRALKLKYQRLAWFPLFSPPADPAPPT